MSEPTHGATTHGAPATDQPSTQGPQKGIGPAMIRTLVVTALISGLMIVTAYQITLPTVKANRARQLREAVFSVLPGATATATFRLESNGTLVPAGEDDERAVRVHAGYNAEGKLVGVAVEASGMGYQDVIRVLYGYDPEREVIVGMKVLDSKETPGLGDKITKDPKFLANFEALQVKLNAARSALEHPIEVVKGAKRDPWQVDAITGATISSNAIGKLLNQSAEKQMPMLQKNLETLRRR